MFLNNLELVNYKNHSNLCLEFKEHINIFIGKNGAGKTNILDSIYYLAVFRSHIQHLDQQNIKHNESFFRLKGVFDNDYEVIAKYSTRQKSIEINNTKISKYSEYFGHIPVVLSSPGDIFLLHDGSEERRKLIDFTISIYDKEYLLNLNKYNQYLEQRNALLKSQDSIEIDLIKYFDRQLVPLGIYIFNERVKTIDELNIFTKKWYNEIAKKEEILSSTYSSQLLEGDFQSLLDKNLERDIILKRSTVGIHKDDIKIEMTGFDIKKIASQGQQKSLLYALRFAQSEFIYQKTNKKLIFLLDDYSDKLDSERKNHLLDIIKNVSFISQWFITDTEELNFLNLKSNKTIFYI